jgi:hypothetical protein
MAADAHPFFDERGVSRQTDIDNNYQAGLNYNDRESNIRCHALASIWRTMTRPEPIFRCNFD